MIQRSNVPEKNIYSGGEGLPILREELQLHLYAGCYYGSHVTSEEMALYRALK
jgi:hypothetical protein